MIVFYLFLAPLVAPFLVVGFIVWGLIELIRILFEKDDDHGFSA